MESIEIDAYANDFNEKMRGTSQVKYVRVRQLDNYTAPKFVEWMKHNQVCEALYFDVVTPRKGIIVPPTLKTLSFEHCEVSSDVLKPILDQAPNLETVSFQHCRIDGTCVFFLSKIPHLSSLTIAHGNITNGLYYLLNIIPCLKELNIGGAGLADRQLVVSLIEALRRAPALRRLDISENWFKSFAELASYLRENISLRYLNLARIFYRGQDMHKFIVLEALMQNTGLHEIAQYPLEWDLENITKRNRAAFKLCKSSSLCVAWCGSQHFLGRDVMGIIAKMLWDSRGTRFWIFSEPALPARKKSKK